MSVSFERIFPQNIFLFSCYRMEDLGNPAHAIANQNKLPDFLAVLFFVFNLLNQLPVLLPSGVQVVRVFVRARVGLFAVLMAWSPERRPPLIPVAMISMRWLPTAGPPRGRW